MFPTECFKDHDIPLGGKKKEKQKPTEKEKKKKRLMWSFNLLRCPYEQLAHLGAPRLGATATNASWSPFSTEMKTPSVVGH